MRIRSPGFTSPGRSLKEMEAISLLPTISRVVKVNISPARSSALPSSRRPRRISGPLVSKSAATGAPSFSRMRTRVSKRAACSG